jgi:hypothetical protein
MENGRWKMLFRPVQQARCWQARGPGRGGEEMEGEGRGRARGTMFNIVIKCVPKFGDCVKTLANGVIYIVNIRHVLHPWR